MSDHEPYWVAFGNAAQMLSTEASAIRRRAETDHPVEGPFTGDWARELCRLYMTGRR